MRDQYLAAVEARLDQVESSRNPAITLDRTAVAEAWRLAGLLEDGDLAVRSALGWFCWYRCLAQPESERAADHAMAVRLLARTFLVGAGPWPDPLLLDLAAEVEDEASDLLDRVFELGDDDTAQVVALWRRMAGAVPPDHDDHPMVLWALGVALIALYERTGRLEEVEEAVDVGIEALELTSPDHPAFGVLQSGLCASLRERYSRTSEVDDIDQAVVLGRASVRSTGEGHAFHPGAMINLGHALLVRSTTRGGTSDLEESVGLTAEALRRMPADSPDRPAAVVNLCLGRLARFERLGDLGDLDEAIHLARRTRSLLLPGDPNHATLLSHLAAALALRFEHTGDLPDLNEAIEVGTEALRVMAPGHPNRSMFSIRLSACLLSRTLWTGSGADLDEAVRHARAGLDAAEGTVLEPTALMSASQVLTGRFARDKDLGDLEESVRLVRRAIDLIPADHTDHQRAESVLSLALLQRYQRLGAVGDLDEAAEAGERAVAAMPPEYAHRAMALSSLSACLTNRYLRTSDLADLDRGIAVGRQAIAAMSPDHPARPGAQTSVATALLLRATRLSDIDNAREAVAFARAATKVAPGHPEQGNRLATLAATLRVLYQRTGRPDHLNEAISAGREAAEQPDPGNAAGALITSGLSLALLTRFETTGAVEDLDDAVATARRGLTASPPDEPAHFPLLIGLSLALLARFGRLDRPQDLDEAVRTARAAIEAAPPDHPELPRLYFNLSLGHRARYATTGDPAELTASVQESRAALAAVPSGHIDRPLFLHNVALAVLTVHEEVGDPGARDESIDLMRSAVESAPHDYPSRWQFLMYLAAALHQRFLDTGAVADRDEALTTALASAEVDTAPPAARARTATLAASLLAGSDVEQAADLAESAVRWLPETASRELARGDQQHALVDFSGLATDAAALALSGTSGSAGERAERALGLLELGRGVILAQAIDGRSELGDLEHHAPALARRFRELRDELAGPSRADPPLPATVTVTAPAGLGADGPGMTLPDAGPREATASDWKRHSRDRHRVAGEFARLVQEIRELDGFERFMLPPAPAELVEEAAGGNVVLLVVSAFGSHALLLRGDGVGAVPLPDLTPEALVERAVTFFEALDDSADADLGIARRSAAQRTLHEVLGWLWDVAAGPCLDALGHRAPPGPGEAWPRLWWVPSGLLSMLPLHAAGHHRDPGATAPRTVMDRVVSSYAPTVRSLRHARAQGRTGPPGRTRAVVVSMPTTPGADELPHAAAEAELLRRLPADVEVLSESAATKDAVLARLTESAVAHFACHARADMDDPSNSRLLLHDHRTDPLTVTSLDSVSLDRARIAFLSACSTAFNAAPELADEALHMSAAFQLAGYPQVISTLWEIDDAYAAHVARRFYEELGSPGVLAVDRAAEALHRVVRASRDEFTAVPSRWAAHLHSGV